MSLKWEVTALLGGASKQTVEMVIVRFETS